MQQHGLTFNLAKGNFIVVISFCVIRMIIHILVSGPSHYFNIYDCIPFVVGFLF